LDIVEQFEEKMGQFEQLISILDAPVLIEIKKNLLLQVAMVDTEIEKRSKGPQRE
jgi:flagellar assembly factor FliW